VRLLQVERWLIDLAPDCRITWKFDPVDHEGEAVVARDADPVVGLDRVVIVRAAVVTVPYICKIDV